MTVYEVIQWLDNGLKGEELKVIFSSNVGIFSTWEKAEQAVAILEDYDSKNGQEFSYGIEDRTINRFVTDDADIIYDLNDKACLDSRNFTHPSNNVSVKYIVED